MQPNKSYVYEGVEVTMTGRHAKRQATTIGGRRDEEIVEITPVDQDEADWKKWVKVNDLFEVQ